MMAPVSSKRGNKSGSPSVESATPQTVRHINRALVLDLIRAHQPVSRASLARYAGIHRSNISIIIEDLQKCGLLREERSKKASRGRTPTLISFDRGTLRVVAVNMRKERTTIALVSFDAQVESTYSFETPSEPEAFVDEMEAAIQSMTGGSNLDRKTPTNVVQLVMSIPGILDSIGENKSTIWTPALEKFSGVDLASSLERRLGFPCLLANNAGLGAIAALHEAEARGEQMGDFVFLVIGDVGVGSGVILHHSLYSGYDAAYAGEVGHSVIDPRGPQCSCGRRGCWQLYVCDRATWARFNPKVDFSVTRFDELLREVDAGSAKALAALKVTASYLSLGISNIALMLNPEKILVAGALTRVWPRLQRELKSAFFLPHHHAKIYPVESSVDNLFLRGAIEHAIDLALRRFQ